jgi:hypothetical protein
MPREHSGKRFQIRFRGAGMTPRNVRLGELGDLLASLESAVAAINGTAAEEVRMGLVQVRSQSAAYALESSSVDASTAMKLWWTAVREKETTGLPPAAQEASKKILAFVKRHDCVGEMRESGVRKVLAKITPLTTFATTLPDGIRSHTVLYGEVVRVGGVERKLMLRVHPDKPAVTVSIKTKELARELGARLYETVGVAGSALWHPVTDALLGFDAEELLPYDGSALDAIANVSALVGSELDAVDMEEFVATIRGNSDDRGRSE